MKTFISYCHEDSNQIPKILETLEKCDIPVENIWYDRHLKPGEDLDRRIFQKIDECQIFIQLVSHDYLMSTACNEEFEYAEQHNANRRLRIIPVIISSCDWIKKGLGNRLAVPTDGKAINKHESIDEAWEDVRKQLCSYVKQFGVLNDCSLEGGFIDYIQSTGLLEKSHPDKKRLLLDDIFIDLQIYPRDNQETIALQSSSEISSILEEKGKIVIEGNHLSGKTSLLFKTLERLVEENYLPILIKEDGSYQGNFSIKLEKAVKAQYGNIDISKLSKDDIVILFDDFHHVGNKKKVLEELNNYSKQVLIVDDIYSLDFKSESILKNYHEFTIAPLTKSLRSNLVNKWVSAKDKNHDEASFLKETDRLHQLVESILGKLLGKGVIPSTPFYVLTILSDLDTNNSTNSSITSQGHCYQSLLYIFLRKQGISNELYDTYLNFLTEIAIVVNRSGGALSQLQFDDFVEKYEEEFNTPESLKNILRNLAETNIFGTDDFGNYVFKHDYLYYFFIGKFISENLSDNIEFLDEALDNIHLTENGYIISFISHHTKSDIFLNKLIEKADTFFVEYPEASLKSSELDIFDSKKDAIIKAVLPSAEIDVKRIREERLIQADEEEIEDLNKQRQRYVDKIESDRNKTSTTDAEEKFITEIRSAVQTAEVIGTIIKNRSGSIPKNELNSLFGKALSIHLRFMGLFFKLLKNPNSELEVVEILMARIKEDLESSKSESQIRNMKSEDLKSLAEKLYWNINFSFNYASLQKAIRSLGSELLLIVAQSTFDSDKTPAKFIVSQGIQMWYAKNLRLDEMKEQIEQKEFSWTAEMILKHKVVEHLVMHKVNPQMLKQVEFKIGIPAQKVFVAQRKK